VIVVDGVVGCVDDLLLWWDDGGWRLAGSRSERVVGGCDYVTVFRRPGAKLRERNTWEQQRDSLAFTSAIHV
jgi:hypothetical protein